VCYTVVMSFGYVYGILNRVDGKVYIGQTRNAVHKRWMQHVAASATSPLPLHAAIREYGKECFTVHTLDVVPVSELRHWEQKRIAEHESLDPEKGYNRQGGRIRKCPLAIVIPDYATDEEIEAEIERLIAIE